MRNTRLTSHMSHACAAFPPPCQQQQLIRDRDKEKTAEQTASLIHSNDNGSIIVKPFCFCIACTNSILQWFTNILGMYLRENCGGTIQIGAASKSSCGADCRLNHTRKRLFLASSKRQGGLISCGMNDEPQRTRHSAAIIGNACKTQSPLPP